MVPLNLAVKVVDCPPASDAVVGEIVIETGTKEIVALALMAVLAALVAVTVTVSADAIVAGAV